MEKIKVYYIEEKINFRHYLNDYLVDLIRHNVIELIRKDYSEMKYIFDEDEKRNKIKSIIKELKEVIQIDWFKNFTYYFDFTTNRLRFDTLAEVEFFYSYHKNHNLDVFSLSEHIDVSYNLDNVNAIEITNEDDLYDTFERVNVGLIVMTINFILYEYWIKEYKQPQKSKIIKKEMHPSIFEVGAFTVFLKWLKISKEKEDKSISFIFQKLKQENKLRNTNFKDLLNWSYENEFISKECFDKLIVRGYFDTPSKILTKTRNTLYNTITDN